MIKRRMHDVCNSNTHIFSVGNLKFKILQSRFGIKVIIIIKNDNFNSLVMLIYFYTSQKHMIFFSTNNFFQNMILKDASSTSAKTAVKY